MLSQDFPGPNPGQGRLLDFCLRSLDAGLGDFLSKRQGSVGARSNIDGAVIDGRRLHWDFHLMAYAVVALGPLVF